MLYAYATVFDTLQITIASIDNLDIIGCDCILHSHILGWVTDLSWVDADFQSLFSVWDEQNPSMKHGYKTKISDVFSLQRQKPGYTYMAVWVGGLEVWKSELCAK